MKAQYAEEPSDDLASYICGVLLIAGSDTTAAELAAFIQAMILFPEVQKRAWEEVDKVCGDRMPTEEDAELMPYIACCVMPTTILGMPHCVMRDDEYMGYTIPKDAIVIYNAW